MDKQELRAQKFYFHVRTRGASVSIIDLEKVNPLMIDDCGIDYYTARKQLEAYVSSYEPHPRWGGNYDIKVDDPYYRLSTLAEEYEKQMDNISNVSLSDLL